MEEDRVIWNSLGENFLWCPHHEVTVAYLCNVNLCLHLMHVVVEMSQCHDPILSCARQNEESLQLSVREQFLVL